MPLLNYRTTVPASRTASEVQVLLVKAGARGVAMEFDDAGGLMAGETTVYERFVSQQLQLEASNGGDTR